MIKLLQDIRKISRKGEKLLKTKSGQIMNETKEKSNVKLN